jgi:hypothetical protein
VGDAQPIAKGDVYPTLFIPPVSRWALIKMGVLTTLGIAVVATSIQFSPSCTTQAAGFNCHVVIMTSAAMWLAWALLAFLAFVATQLYRGSATGTRQRGRGVMLTGVVLAYCAVVGFFPPLLALMTSMNAAL